MCINFYGKMKKKKKAGGRKEWKNRKNIRESKTNLSKDVKCRLRHEDRKKSIPSFWVRLYLPKSLINRHFILDGFLFFSPVQLHWKYNVHEINTWNKWQQESLTSRSYSEMGFIIHKQLVDFLFFLIKIISIFSKPVNNYEVFLC